jgi:hypothetical protein
MVWACVTTYPTTVLVDQLLGLMLSIGEVIELIIINDVLGI